MDLRDFSKVKNSGDKEVLLDEREITIKKNNDELSYNIKTKEKLKEYENKLLISPSNGIFVKTEEELQIFFEKSISDGVEGVMVKSLDSGYKPGMRTGAQAKLKETKEDLDLVIIGAEHGKGKRAGYYSSFLVAVKGEEDEVFEIGKVSSGIKELDEEGASLKRLSELLEPLRISEEGEIIRFEPKVIIQVKYQEIQKSTNYSSGFALRFPRIISLREDKLLDEINSIDDIERMV